MLTQSLQRLIEFKQWCWWLPYRVRSARRIAEYLRAYAGDVRLNIGSSAHLLDGWLNADLWPSPGTVYLDATKPLPLPTGSVRFINGEHLVEHLELAAGRHFLQESARILQPDGLLRLSTPDLGRLVQLYLGQGADSQAILAHHRAYHNPTVETLCAWLNDHFRAWGHRFLYDEPTLTEALRQARFTEIRRCGYGESRHPALRDIDRHDEGASWIPEAYVMILEAGKAP